MKLNVKFEEKNQTFDTAFGELLKVSDGGFESGYSQGHAVGFEEGYQEGLAERQYEIWTITLTDGTVVEKEVALL